MTETNEVDSPKARAATLVRETFERSGRGHEKDLLAEALKELAWNNRSGTVRELAAYAIGTTGLRVVPGAGPLEVLPSGREDSVARTLGVLDEEERLLNSRLVSIRQEASYLRSRAVKRRLVSQGRPVPDDLELGSHFCDASPVGLCCYDGDEDPGNDDCLFCHGPDERR